MPLHKVLMRSHQEAFSQDTCLVRKMREEYFRNQCPNFYNENTHDLMDVFQHMIETAGLLGSAIYKIQEAWTGWDKLQDANYMLRTLPRGLKFIWAVSPSESPKVMGLVGIHHPNMLQCFNGVTHCPWCRKRSNRGHHHQPPEDGALQVGSHMWEVFLLPLHHIRGHPVPQLKKLPTFGGGRCWRVILISVTTGTKHARLTSPWWEPGQRIWGRTQCQYGHLIGDTPCPISMELKGGSEGRSTTHQPNAYLSPWSSHMLTRQLLPSMNPRLSAMFTKNAEIYKHQRLSNY